ncbi:MAG: hypothetical protein D6771_03000 [Zetaproteobacteria bacterium]|nr:MAG: hypothetical protein D6771_03000 [Zetaproteobacteria bacterium]
MRKLWIVIAGAVLASGCVVETGPRPSGAVYVPFGAVVVQPAHPKKHRAKARAHREHEKAHEEHEHDDGED